MRKKYIWLKKSLKTSKVAVITTEIPEDVISWIVVLDNEGVEIHWIKVNMTFTTHFISI